jgi:LysM repeat protein
MKMKIPKLKLFRRKKLHVAAARRPLRIAATADCEEMAEPNMKLSRALLIVLVLHVVAVSGIIAFNAIKTRQTPASVSPRAATNSTPPVRLTTKPDNSSSYAATAQKENGRHDEAKLSHSPVKQIAKEDRKTDHAKSSEAMTSADSAKVYVVAKGDNPVTIAKKLKVSYDDLLALNHIDDPRKLQIGQKLLIPSKTTKGKKASE